MSRSRLFYFVFLVPRHLKQHLHIQTLVVSAVNPLRHTNYFSIPTRYSPFVKNTVIDKRREPVLTNGFKEMNRNRHVAIAKADTKSSEAIQQIYQDMDRQKVTFYIQNKVSNVAGVNSSFSKNQL